MLCRNVATVPIRRHIAQFITQYASAPLFPSPELLLLAAVYSDSQLAVLIADSAEPRGVLVILVHSPDVHQ